MHRETHDVNETFTIKLFFYLKTVNSFEKIYIYPLMLFFNPFFVLENHNKCSQLFFYFSYRAFSTSWFVRVNIKTEDRRFGRQHNCEKHDIFMDFPVRENASERIFPSLENAMCFSRKQQKRLFVRINAEWVNKEIFSYMHVGAYSEWRENFSLE